MGRWTGFPTVRNPWGQQVTTPIYLLVGRRDKVYDNPNDPNISNTNLNDFTSLWVAVNSATGLIVVTDLAATGTTSSVLLQNAKRW